MNGNDERSMVPVDADMISGGCRAQGNNVASGLNSSSSTIKIDSLCIKLGIVKEKGDVQKCRHFSIRGYVAEMREKGRSNLLPFANEQLPPIEVPQFRYWLCQRCVQNCGTANTSHETALTSVCDQIIVRPCAKVSNPQQDCKIGVAVLPFGEGTSGLKSVDGGNDDTSIHAALGADNGQSSQEIPAKAAAPQEPTKFSSVDTNVAAEVNVGVSGEKESSGLREFDDLENANMVKETTTTLVDQPFQSCQHNDYSNGPPRRKARKVRLLKELLSGNAKNSQQKRENSALRLGPKASSPSAASPQIKRKILHDHDHDQRSVDITTPGYVGKKAKPSKGNNVVKTSVVEHCRDPGSGEGGQETNKYQWQKHGTQRSSVLDKVGSDPVTTWRSIFSDMERTVIFSDMERTDDQVTAVSGGSRPAYDISKGRGTEPYSSLMAPPPQSDKNLNPSKKISRNPLKSKFYGDDSRKMNVGGSRTKDSQSDTELGLGLSLNNDPQAQVRPLPSVMNRNPTQDHGRRTDSFLGESSIPHRIPSDLKSKEGYVHDVSNRHAPRPAILQEQWPPFTQLQYGSCSGHQKLDFSDPYKRNIGVRLYSDVMRPHNHERREKMFSIGRSDEREIVELMAKNQYERSLCEARSHRPPGSNNNNWMIPNPSGFPKVSMNDEMPCLHQEYLNMIRPSSSISNISMMPTNENMGPTAMRNPAASLFHSDQLSSFAMFDAFSQCQKQPSSGIWISNSGNQRHHDPCYHHAPKSGNKKIPDSHLYPTTNMQVLEAFSPYRNGTNVSFSQEYAKCSEKDKGKSVMNLDLNVVAPNAVEEPNNSGSLDLTYREYRNPYHPKEQRNDLNPKHISSLDSSYSNEAIPAMQLLSLMDAGKSSHHPFMGAKKFTKPLSPCYNHCSSTVAGKTNPIANSCFPYSGMRPSLQKPIGSPTHFLSGPESSSLPSGRFQADQDVNGRQVYHKPQEEKSRNAYSPSLSHGYRREDAYVFPLPWHATEDRNERVSRTFGSRIDPPGTTICTINQNPADFSTPGPENEYMIDYEDLKLRGESSYKRKPASENPNGPKRQKRP